MKKLVSLSFMALTALAATGQQNVNYGVLDINNIAATINANGKLFARSGDYQSNPGFEVYKSGKHTLNAAGLWITGVADDNSNHLMAPTFNSYGFDGFAGPAMIHQNYPSQDAKYNRVWKVSADEIKAHTVNYNKPGYTMPEAIANWPAHGDVNLGMLPNIAPFVDVNSNNIYEPTLGDYPQIKGDQAIFFVYNDHRQWHTETGGTPLGVEIRGLAYAFDVKKTNEAFNNTVFVEYEIVNRTATNYHDVYIGLFNDIDVGNPYNDFVGCDVARNTFWAFNANPGDPEFAGIADQPVQSVKFLNEGLNGFVAYDNDWSVRGNPFDQNDYINYLRGYWKDGQPITFGGNGRGDAKAVARFMYPGSTDPVVAGNWEEEVTANQPADRRGLGVVGPFNFGAFGTRKIALAYNFATTTKKMPKNLDKIQSAYSNQSGPFKNTPTLPQNGSTEPSRPTSNFAMVVYPNPMTSQATVKFDNPKGEEFLIQVFDLSGRLLLSKPGIRTNTFEIERGTMSPGIYVVELRNGSIRQTAKLIVQD